MTILVGGESISAVNNNTARHTVFSQGCALNELATRLNCQIPRFLHSKVVYRLIVGKMVPSD